MQQAFFHCLSFRKMRLKKSSREMIKPEETTSEPTLRYRSFATLSTSQNSKELTKENGVTTSL